MYTYIHVYTCIHVCIHVYTNMYTVCTYICAQELQPSLAETFGTKFEKGEAEGLPSSHRRPFLSLAVHILISACLISFTKPPPWDL